MLPTPPAGQKLTNCNVDHAIETEADLIDSQITSALKLEKDTSHKQYGYPWSPTLANAGRNITFWRKCIRIFKSGEVPGACLTPSQIPSNRDRLSHGCPGRSKQFYVNELDDAWINLHLTQDKSKELRRGAFLGKHITAADMV